MEEATAVFEPLKTPGWPLFLSLAGTILTGAGVWLQLRNKSLDRNRRMVLSMLLFFGFLIALFTGAGILVNATRFKKVTVYASGISIGKKDIPFSEMRGYLIREDRSRSWVNPNVVKKTVRSMVIEEKNRKTHLLPEEYYDLPRLIAAMDSAYSAWKKPD